MKELLENFSIEQILIFGVLLALAIKGVVSFFDWLQDRNKKIAKKIAQPESLKDKINKNNKEIDDLKKSIQVLTKKIDLLIESDKDDIKAYITKQHHHFCYEQGWIDDYSLDCIEKRFGHYEEQGGNSFIQGLMEEIRDLPKRNIQRKKG